MRSFRLLLGLVVLVLALPNVLASLKLEAAFATQFGNSAPCGPVNCQTTFNSVAVLDSTGDVYAAGQTNTNNLPIINPTSSTQTVHGGGTWDCFLVIFDVHGNVTYSSYVGGDGDDTNCHVQVEEGPQVYMVFQTASTNLTTTSLTENSLKGPTDVYIARADMTEGSPDFVQPLYGFYRGGNGDDAPLAVTLASISQIGSQSILFVGGWTDSTDIMTAVLSTVNYELSSAYIGNEDGLFFSLSAADGSNTYRSYFGGDNNERVTSISVYSTQGTPYVAVSGWTTSSNFLAINGQAISRENSMTGSGDGFVIAFDDLMMNILSTGFIRFFGGDGLDECHAITFDSLGNYVISGTTTSTDLATMGADQQSLIGATDAFVGRLDYGTKGTPLVVSYVGTADTDGLAAVATHNDIHYLALNTHTFGSLPANGSPYGGTTYSPALTSNERPTYFFSESNSMEMLSGSEVARWSQAPLGGNKAITVHSSSSTQGRVYIAGSGVEVIVSPESIVAQSNGPISALRGQLLGFDISQEAYCNMNDVCESGESCVNCDSEYGGDCYCGKPTVVKNLRISFNSPVQVDISWENADLGNATAISHYTLTRVPPFSSNPEKSIPYTASSYTFGDTDVVKSTSYTYTVRGVTDLDALGPSTSIPNTTPSQAVKPSSPISLASPANLRGPISIGLTWVAPATTGGSPLSTYKVEMSSTSASSGFAEVLKVTHPTTSATVMGLTPGNIYYFRVSASNIALPTVFSNPSTVLTTFTLAAGVPSAVAKPSVVEKADGEVTISWFVPQNNGDEIEGYDVQRGNPSNSFVLYVDGSVTTGGVLTHRSVAMKSGVEYTFRVRAINGIGKGPYSEALTVVVDGKGSSRSNDDIAIAISWSLTGASVMLAAGFGYFSKLPDANPRFIWVSYSFLACSILGFVAAIGFTA